jgi:type II secretory pathway pseudopilin PulG
MVMPSRSSTGYTLIVCVIAITLLSIAVATALPLWSGQIKRDKEAELVFRGLQYAEAIRVFQRRFGRPPSRLEELMEVQPRSIRQLWKDPLTEDGKWVILVAGPQGGQGGQGQGGGAPPNPDGEETGTEADPGQPNAQPVGPIIGVRSRAKGESMRSFFGVESYSGWRFTVDLLSIRPPGPDGLPGIPRAAWIGKAFPEGVSAQMQTQDVPQTRRRRGGAKP